MRLFLVRHGQTAWNLSGRVQGHVDEPLDEDGVHQSQQLAEVMSGDSIELVLSSDLRRCFETANLLATSNNAQLRTSRDLRERSFGEFEGSDFEVMKLKLLEIGLSASCSYDCVRPLGGESLQDVWVRVEAIAAELRVIDRSCVAVVSHGGTLGLLLARLLEGTVHTARCFRFGNTSVTELFRQPDRAWKMIRYADTSHLRSAALL